MKLINYNLTLSIVILLALSGDYMTSGKQEKEFSGSDSSKFNPLGLSGDQFWNDPTSIIDSIVSDRMFSEKDGFLIATPEKVYLDLYETIPLVCVHTAETNKFVRHSLTTTTQLVSVCLETGDIRLVKLAPSPVIKDDRVHPPGYSSRKLEVDLKMLDVVYPAFGRHAVMLLCGSECSNQQIIEVIPASDERTIENYQKEIALIRSVGPQLPVKEAYLQWGIQHHENANPDNKKHFCIVKQKPEGESDTRISIDFNVVGLPRFSFQEKQIFTPDKKTVFAALPVALIGFNEARTLVINNRIALPVISPLTGTEENPVLSGNVSFLLSALLPPETIDKKISLWCVTMEYFSLVEVKNKQIN